MGRPELAKDPAYIDNKARLAHRADIVGKLSALTEKRQSADLPANLVAVGVRAGPINNSDPVKPKSKMGRPVSSYARSDSRSQP